MSNISETEALIADLCERFTHIFEQIKDIKKSRQELEEENRSLQSMIQEENQKFEEVAEQLESATEELQRKCDEADERQQQQQQQQGAEASASQLINIDRLQQELEQKKALLEVAQVKLREVTNELHSNEQVRAAMERQKQILEERLASLKTKIGEHQDVAATVENNLLEINAKNEELAQKVQTMMVTIAHNEQELKQTLESKHQREDDYKLSKQEYREVLAQSAQYTNKTKDAEKAIARLRDELKSKLARLDVLLKNKVKLETRVQRLEQLRTQYEEQCQKNQELAEENQRMSQKLQLYLQENEVALPAAKQLSRSASKQQLLNQSHSQPPAGERINTSHVSAANVVVHQTPKSQSSSGKRETELYRLAKQNVLQSDYLQNLAKTLAERDNQIFENKKKINQINADINNLRERITTTKKERAELEQKYAIMKQNTEQLKEQYVALCQDFGIQEQRAGIHLAVQKKK